MWDRLVRKAARKETFSRWTAELHLCPEYVEFGQSKLTLFIVVHSNLVIGRIGWSQGPGSPRGGPSASLHAGLAGETPSLQARGVICQGQLVVDLEVSQWCPRSLARALLLLATPPHDRLHEGPLSTSIIPLSGVLLFVLTGLFI